MNDFMTLNRPLHPNSIDTSDKSLNFDLEMRETDDSFEVHADLPGVKKDEIEIELTGNILSISATKKSEYKEQSDKEDETTKYYFSERMYGSFSRSIRLPSHVDEDSVTASYSDGVLNVRVLKLAKSKKKRITVD